MAIRQIVKIGDDILRIKSKEVTVFDDRLGELIDDMIETMIDASGAGLAAPQVGILKRVIVVSTDGKTYYSLVNPKITKMSGTQQNAEGCLSIPGRSGTVERPKKIVVEGFDRDGKEVKIKAEGYLATAFCHEIDHLDGILYVDKIIEE